MPNTVFINAHLRLSSVINILLILEIYTSLIKEEKKGVLFVCSLKHTLYITLDVRKHFEHI